MIDLSTVCLGQRRTLLGGAKFSTTASLLVE
jgi:hypothetical protein